jgi:excisionase family DNA binding protein
MEANTDRFVLIPADELNQLKLKINRLTYLFEERLSDLKQKSNRYLTAQEFMNCLNISRSTFDSLREENKIKVIQKGRKLYLSETEIERYMNS